MVIPKDKGCFNLWSSKQNGFRPHVMVNSLDFINGFWMSKILKPISSEFAAYVSGAFCLSEFMCFFKCFCISLEQFVLIRIQETCIQENDSRPLENILPKKVWNQNRISTDQLGEIDLRPTIKGLKWSTTVPPEYLRVSKCDCQWRFSIVCHLYFFPGKLGYWICWNAILDDPRA